MVAILKNSTFALVLGCAFLGILFFAQDTHAQNTHTDRVLDAADLGLVNWLEKIPAGGEKGYGFHSRSDFARATLGTPVRMVTIDPQDVDSGTMTKMMTWRVPILLDGEYRALLTVIRQDDTYRTVSLGAAVLATEMGQFKREGVGAGSDQETYLLRIHRLSSDFIVVARRNTMIEDGDIYPMRSARGLIESDAQASGAGYLGATRLKRPQVIEILKRGFNRLPVDLE